MMLILWITRRSDEEYIGGDPQPTIVGLQERNGILKFKMVYQTSTAASCPAKQTCIYFAGPFSVFITSVNAWH